MTSITYLKRALLSLLVGYGWLSSIAFAQKLEVISNYCVFDGSTLPDKIYSFDSDPAAQAALRRVMQATGLEPNFVIRAASVPNAAASIEETQRVILYNQQWMMNIRATTKTEWSLLSILAHEVGHHLQGHTLLRGGSRPEIELQADKYSGFVLRRMKATLEEAQAAMLQFASEKGTSTHPGRAARLAAIMNGWQQAKDLEDQKPDPAPPAPSPVPQPPPGPSTVPLPVPPGRPPIQTPPPSQGMYVSRVVFQADPVAYYVTQTNEIVGIHPQTGMLVIVGRKIPPTFPGFAWMYATAAITYGVTADGRVIHRDQFGNSFQIGYVTNP